jgi:hypothetical protein
MTKSQFPFCLWGMKPTNHATTVVRCMAYCVISMLMVPLLSVCSSALMDGSGVKL